MTRFDCGQLVSRLDDLIDGALDEHEATAARAHLESCADCRAELELARELADATRALPESIEPDRDLWPGIAKRIDRGRVVRGPFEHRPERNRHRWLMVAAAAAVLIASVTLAYLVGVEHSRPQVAEDRPDRSTYTLAAYGDLATDLELARDQLRSSLDQRRGELSHETWSVVMENMSVIDEAIERIETALADNPNDGRLNRQLAVAYRRQIDLLQRATLLPAEV
jgi:hypothetical protein